MTPVPFLMLLAAPQGAGPHHIVLPRLTHGCGAAACTRARPSPYRLERDSTVPIDAKARAFANDGTYCAVVGDKYCTSKPRTLLRMPIDP